MLASSNMLQDMEASHFHERKEKKMLHGICWLQGFFKSSGRVTTTDAKKKGQSEPAHAPGRPFLRKEMVVKPKLSGNLDLDL